MNFKEFLEERELEEAMSPALKKGLIAGALGLGALSAPFLATGRQKVQPPQQSQAQSPEAGPAQVRVQMSQEYIDELKDEGDWYNSETAKKLVKLAKEGDEWAIRELPWPENHPFHKRGRPYFRNDGPHPDGLDFEVRWKPPSAEHPY